MDDRVRRPLHEPPALVRRLVARQPVVSSLEGGEHGQQHGDVALGARAHRRHRRREHDAAVEDVGEHREQQHEDQGDEQPVEDEAEERQPEDVEPDVGVELAVGDVERLAVAEQQPRLPLRRRRQGDEDGEQEGPAVAQQAQAVPEDLVEALHERVGVGREARRREPVGDHQVDAGQEGEREEEHPEQRRLGADDAPEHVGATRVRRATGSRRRSGPAPDRARRRRGTGRRRGSG